MHELFIVANHLFTETEEQALADRQTHLRSLRERGIESYLTVGDIAVALSVSTETVLRQFADREGVIDLGAAESMHKRGKRLLRIPRHVYETYVGERQVEVRRRIK